MFGIVSYEAVRLSTELTSIRIVDRGKARSKQSRYKKERATNGLPWPITLILFDHRQLSSDMLVSIFRMMRAGLPAAT